MNSHILPIFALIIAAGIFFGYVNPTWTVSIAGAKAVIANDDQAIAAANVFIAQQNKLASARNAIDPANIARITAFLPDSVDNVGIILNLNALAARSGLSISNLDIMANSAANAPAAAGATSNSVNSTNLSLTAVGTYSALQAFLTGVEKSQRLLDVRDMVVKGSDTGVYSYQMILRLYWLH